MKKILSLVGVSALLAPYVSYAQVVATGSTGLGDIMNMLVGWLIALPRLLVFAAIALILYQVVAYIWNKQKDDATVEDTKKAFGKILTSIGLLIIALSIWGIMAIISATFGLGIGGEINQDFIPSVDLSDTYPFTGQ